MKKTTAFLALAACLAGSFGIAYAADASIPPAMRVRNVNGNCVWAAAETTTTAAGWQSFKGITQRAAKEGWHGSSMEAVVKAYKDAGIEYKLQPRKDRSATIFQDAMAEGVGCYFEIYGSKVGYLSDHALVCIGIDDKKARVIDNNGPPVVQEWSREYFDNVRQGGGLFPLFRCRPCPNGVCPAPVVVPQPDHPTLLPEPPLKPAVDLNAELKAQIAKIQLTPGPAGPKGADGQPGPQGPAGKDGAAGQPADAAVIAALNQRVAALEAAMNKITTTRTIVVPVK